MQTISPTPRTLQAGFYPTERGSFTYSECDIFKYWHTFTFMLEDIGCVFVYHLCMKSLKIQNEQSDSVDRRTDKTMASGKQLK